jgi:RNA polymerase sigma-70 factor (sigma-E family)
LDRQQVRAFEAFVNESGAALLRAATLLTSDRHAAEDVYQETLQRLFLRWSRVDNPGGFCRRVMHNIVIDLARARQRRPRELELRENYDGKDPQSADQVSAAELRPTVLSALDTLTIHQRAIVVLRYFEDLSQDEVAGLLGISSGTVKSTASIAMARLRAQPGLVALFADATTTS